MNNTMYFLRRKSFDYIERELTRQFDLKLCYKNKKESIFKNNELLVTCKDKFISVLIYDEDDRNKIYEIVDWISKS